jgi:hypothetical protein
MDLSEVKKHNLLSDLEIIEKRTKQLYRLVSDLNEIDNDTKKNIRNLYDLINSVHDEEFSKELKKQKANGKEFLSDSEIDDLVNKIVEEDLDDCIYYVAKKEWEINDESGILTGPISKTKAEKYMSDTNNLDLYNEMVMLKEIL